MLRISKFFGSLVMLSFIISLPSFAQDLKSAIKLTEREEFDAAHKVFDGLIAKEPNNGDNYYYYGECWIKQFMVDSMSVSLKEVTDAALKYYNMGIAKDTANPLNYVGAGRVYILLRKNSEANAKFDKAKKHLPWKNFTKFPIPVAKQALTFAKIAEARSKAPDKTEAELLDLIDKAVERSATVPEVYLIKGDIYLAYNDGSNAIVAYNKANDLDPQSCKSMVKIGELNVRGRNYTDAIENYKNAIKIDSSFAPAYRGFAELYGLAGQWENAIKYYQKFLELSGKNTYARFRYASFLFMAKKYDEALQTINEVLAVDPDYILLHRLAAYSYYETGKYPDGLKEIEIFMKKTPPEKIIASDYTYWGDLLVKLKKDSLAIGKYQSAFGMDTTNCDLLAKMAKSYSKMKKYDKTVGIYQKEINKNCATLQDMFDMGRAYFNLKQWDKVDTIMGTILSKKPDFISALNFRALANANIDTTSEKGLAKKFYEQLIVLYMKDSTKYVKELSQAYDYMRYYYFKQYNITKKCEDAKKSIIYCDKMLAYDPKDEKSLTIKKALTGRCPN
ncbi:MAG: tetratricopeptide repeat protein [Bacteroidales bacterium]|jgi:tetratricopeptide (TPR) repeat protein